MNPNYLVHRAERRLTRAEQQAADVRMAELVGSLTAALGPLTGRLRAVRLGSRRRPAAVATDLRMPLATGN
ncbi:MAG: hypothetical protein ACLQVK_10785 [Acidimicrobiales bacterium]|jgi:hypothetical protein